MAATHPSLGGDLDVAAELNGKLSNDEFIAKVRANTARWESLANYNKVGEDLKNEHLLRLAPIILGLLAGLVGLWVRPQAEPITA